MRTPLGVLKDAVKILERSDCLYCLVGGHAASLYRSQERLTKDVDFALIADPISDSRAVAEEVIRRIELQPVAGVIPPASHEPERPSVCMITAKPDKGEQTGIIDILLPELPWVEPAVDRAQHNKIDLGFARVPVITPEDLVIAKCYALRNDPDRFQDLDDLKEVFLGVKEMDWHYVRGKLQELALSIPEPVLKFAPIG